MIVVHHSVNDNTPTGLVREWTLFGPGERFEDMRKIEQNISTPLL